MECYTKIDEDLFYVGYSDRRVELFENLYPVPGGVSYNSYMILDEKTALFDTVDNSISQVFFENVKAILSGRKLDYIFLTHVEPDHSATVREVVNKYPEAKIVCTSQAGKMLAQFFNEDFSDRIMSIEQNPEIVLGKHNITFVKAPMVHWPEVMFCYDKVSGTLFSADAFGSFGAISGSIYADSVRFDEQVIEDYRRYYTNIVGKHGMPVQNVLKLANNIEIKRICPLHGRVWRRDFGRLIELYDKWSRFESEEKGVLIIYGSVYGGTELACNVLANKLVELGVENIKICDASKTPVSYLLSDTMKYSNIVIASITKDLSIFPKIEDYVADLISHNFKNRVFAVIENGSWAPTAGKQIREKLGLLPTLTVLPQQVTIKSTLNEDSLVQLYNLATEIKLSLGK